MDALRNPALAEETLDPTDWRAVRALSHRMIDDSIDYLRDVRERPVWQEMPAEVKASFEELLPRYPISLEDVYRQVTANLMPYPMGNIHPRFWSWYMGSSNFTGALAEFLAAVHSAPIVPH